MKSVDIDVLERAFETQLRQRQLCGELPGDLEIIRQFAFVLPCPTGWGRYPGFKRGIVMDFAVPMLRVCVETQGMVSGGKYLRAKGYSDYRRRVNALQIAGWLVIEATTLTVADESAVEKFVMAVYSRLATRA